MNTSRALMRWVWRILFSLYALSMVLLVLALAGCASPPVTTEQTRSSTVMPTEAATHRPTATNRPAPTERVATPAATNTVAAPPATATPKPIAGNLILYASAVDLSVASAPNGRMGRYYAFRTLPALPFLDPVFFDAFYGMTENMDPIGLFLLDFRPRLSPDGRSVLLSGLTSYPDAGREGTGTWLIDLDEGVARRLLTDGKIASWNPASDAIAYGEGDALYTLSTAEGAEPQRLFQYPDLWPQYAHWSPDGQWIAALTSTESTAYDTGYAATYWLVPAAGGPARELTTQAAGAIEYVSTDVSWSPDGQFLLARNRVFDLAGNLLSPDYPGRVDWLPDKSTLLSNRKDGLRILTIAGEEIARISEGYFNEVWAFSRDGRQLAYALPRDEAGMAVAVYDLDSGENRVIGVVPGALNLDLLGWSADNTHLIAGIFMETGHEIWTLAAEPGGAIERLLEDAELIEVFPY